MTMSVQFILDVNLHTAERGGNGNGYKVDMFSSLNASRIPKRPPLIVASGSVRFSLGRLDPRRLRTFRTVPIPDPVPSQAQM